MSTKKNEKKIKAASKISITTYAKKIEEFLKKENKPYSEPHIAEQVFNIKIEKEGSNIPVSKEELQELSRIRNALKILVRERRAIESLIEDPDTKEQVMHYSIIGWYATP